MIPCCKSLDGAELKELARKSVVKDRLVMVPPPEGECAVPGDTVTLYTVSELPEFNKERSALLLYL